MLRLSFSFNTIFGRLPHYDIFIYIVEFVHLNSCCKTLGHASLCTCAGIVILSSRGLQAGVKPPPEALGNAGELLFWHNVFVS